MRRNILSFAVMAIVAPLATAVHAQVSTPVTVTFQNGVDGYTGTFDKRIGSDGTNQLGSATPNYYVDGFNTSNSPDIQGLVRFDNVFGTALGQVPKGATILSASLQVTTNGIDPLTPVPGSVDAVSPGPWGVAGLKRSFNATTSYLDFGALGPTFRNGNSINLSATRATGYFDDSIGSNTLPNTIPTDFNNGTMNGDEGFRANVMPIVQSWANDPTAAHGFTIQAGRTGTDNGWQIGTTANPDVARRPKLSVTYTTDAVENFTFQNGVNGYQGTVQNWLRQNNNSGATDFLDGSQLNEAFLDGPAAASPDDRSMVRFNNLFARDGGTIADDAEIVDAYMVITTGVSSVNARTGGAFTAHQMLVDWDTDRDETSKPSVFGDFGNGAGPTEGVDFGAAADLQWGMISDGQAWFNITEMMKGWQEGDANYGVQLQALMHEDGWQIRFTGSAEISARPQLVVRTIIPTSNWAGDNDGIWNVAGSWQSGKIATGLGRIANFGDVITTARTATLDADTTVGALKFESLSGYTINGAATLTLDRSTGETSVTVLSGAHQVNANVLLAKSTVVDVATNSSVRFGGTLTATGVNLTKNGAGTLTLPNFRGAGLSLNAGSTVIAPANTDASTSLVSGLNIATGATLDINNNAMILDYAAASASPLAAVVQAMKDGKILATAGLSNPRFSIAIVEASSLLNRTTYGGVDIDASAVVVDAALRADSNLDNAVNFDDLLTLARNYNKTENVSWTTGDTNYDGAVNFDDLLSLARNYNATTAAGGAELFAPEITADFAADFALAQSLVPEPTMLTLPALASLLVRRRKQRA